MSQFLRDALFIGIKEGVKLSLCLFLAVSYFRKSPHDELKKPLFAGVFIVFFGSFAVLNSAITLAARSFLVKMTGYAFGLFYLASLGALFHFTDTDLLGPFKRLFAQKRFLVPLVFLLAVVYLTPDMAGSSLYVTDLFSMSDRRPAILVAAAAGFSGSLVAGYLLGRKTRIRALDLFELPQVLLALALIKLAAGGVRGFAEFSLIPAVQAGLMKLVHDVVHQLFALFMVPDHPILTVTAWNFIAILFGNAAGLWLSLIVINVPLFFFLKKHFSRGIRIPPEVRSAALRRKIIKSVRRERLLKSIPLFAFMLFIAVTWSVQSGESAAPLYNPEPRPLVAADGRVTAPLQAPSEDLLDGLLHKFSVRINGEDIRLLIMKKPDGTLAACLDACEICPPEGYAQGREHLVCRYCNTPIPLDTLGRPGGCNPIPLDALVSDKDVSITLSEITKKWSMVKAGEAGERVVR